MSENISREDILGTAAKSYAFDKVLRGYDTNQVDEYINNLVKTHKNASEMFDSRLSDMKNENTMLRYELDQTKSELETAMKTINTLRNENDRLAKESAKETIVKVDRTEELNELNDKISKLTSKNRILQDENKKLEDKNRDMQRDIAHLTKKEDKNRNKISELSDQRVRATEDVCKVGDHMRVKCLAVDERGRIKLSRKAAMHDDDKAKA